jgi:hypothetical protein
VIVVGALAAVGTVAFAVTRLVGILPNSGVEVLVPFVDTIASLPIGESRHGVDVEVDQAIITVSNLPGVVVAFLALAVVLDAVTILAILACSGVLCSNLMRGRAFSRTNTRLVIGSAIILVAGTGLGGFVQTMGVNGALAAIGDRSYDSFVASGSLAPYLIATGIAAISVAFKAGERMQRDTAGLV